MTIALFILFYLALNIKLLKFKLHLIYFKFQQNH